MDGGVRGQRLLDLAQTEPFKMGRRIRTKNITGERSMKETTHHMGHRWTTEELKTLMSMWASGESVEAISSVLNSSRGAISKQVVKLRQNGIPLERRTKGNYAGRGGKAWTAGEVEFLIRKRDERATSEEIALSIGRSWQAVSAMIYKLRQEEVPIAMRGSGVRRLYDLEALKGVAVQMASVQ